jgi:hypothetical protein
MRSSDPQLHCQASIIKHVFERSEQGEVRRPGDIFYALVAIEKLVFSDKTRNKFISGPLSFKEGGKMYYYWSDSSNKYNKYNGPLVEVDSANECIPFMPEHFKNRYTCYGYSKYTLKKLKKFKKDPSNEKVLGKPLVKHIKNVRLIKKIREDIGTGNFELVGDMLNASVKDVIKNEVRPELAKRRNLLNKYNEILSNIKDKLDKNKFKSMNKEISKLSKSYIKLQKLKSTTHELDRVVDEAVDIVFEINKLIEESTLKAKDNEDEKLKAMASIYFMDSLIDSILYIIPKKYVAVVNKELSPLNFDDDDIAELDKIINSMIKKNNDNKFAKMTWSTNIINEYINTSNILKKLSALGIQNSLEKPFTQISALNVAEEQIDNNLNKELFKDVKKIVASVTKSDLNDITRQVSETASEVTRVASENFTY